MPRILPELVSYIEGLPEPHIICDREYRIVAANATYRRQFGNKGSVIGRTCYDVSHNFSAPCDRSGESCPLALARESGKRERILHLHRTPKGEAYVSIELTPLRNARAELAYFIEKMEPLRIAHGEPAARGLIGRAPAFREMLQVVARVGPTNASVILLGESGSGKELVARAVHEASGRAARPFVVVDCASLAPTLFESELFGHERGSFTGADAMRVGLVEAANGGTLFLDEVGDIPPAMQVKLLRLLESGTYRRVGSSELRQTDIRVISATHRDLHTMLAADTFRQDLYYRISAFPIRVPPLRERASDIALLAPALLSRLTSGRSIELGASALTRLCRYGFPGNVRELRNILERAALLCDGNVIERADIEHAIAAGQPQPRTPARGTKQSAEGASKHGVPTSLRDIEREVLRSRLHSHQGSRAELARALGISERSLYRRLRELERSG